VKERLALRSFVVWVALAAAGCGGADQACPPDHAIVMDDGRCVGVDRPTLCSGRFCVPDDAACARVLYVQAGASGGGQQASPFGTLVEAVEAASSGDCIALGDGEYDAAPLGAGVSLYGAGAAAVVVRTDPDHRLAVAVGSGARVRGIRVTGAGWGLVASGVGDLRVEEALFDAATEVAVAAFDGAQVTLESATVQSTAGDPGYGLYAGAGARLELHLVLVRDNTSAGVVAIGGSFAVRDSAVLHNGSYGLTAQDSDVTSSVVDTLVSDNAGVGIFASGARISVERVDVGLTRGLQGKARLVEAQAGADVDLLDSVLHESEQAGVLVDGSRLRMTGGEIRDNAERGLWAQRIPPSLLVDGESVRVDGTSVCGNALVGLGRQGRRRGGDPERHRLRHHPERGARSRRPGRAADRVGRRRPGDGRFVAGRFRRDLRRQRAAAPAPRRRRRRVAAEPGARLPVPGQRRRRRGDPERPAAAARGLFREHRLRGQPGDARDARGSAAHAALRPRGLGVRPGALGRAVGRGVARRHPTRSGRTRSRAAAAQSLASAQAKVRAVPVVRASRSAEASWTAS
jgi:hypothetical protein